MPRLSSLLCEGVRRVACIVLYGPTTTTDARGAPLALPASFRVALDVASLEFGVFTKTRARQAVSSNLRVLPTNQSGLLRIPGTSSRMFGGSVVVLWGRPRKPRTSKTLRCTDVCCTCDADAVADGGPDLCLERHGSQELGHLHRLFDTQLSRVGIVGGHAGTRQVGQGGR